MIKERHLREGTEGHYREPRFYDQTYRRRRDDVSFYVSEAERSGGPVLELGVGTGRVAKALAIAGYEVVGVDASTEMLAQAEETLSRLSQRRRDRVTLLEGDLRLVRLRRRFPLVISPFNVFMHMFTREDMEAALATVKAHLAPGGRFVFDVLLPDPIALGRDPTKLYRVGRVRRPEDGRHYRYSETFEYDPTTQIQLIRMIFEDEDDPLRVIVSLLAHRQFFPVELRDLLHYNGFDVESHLGGFDGRTLDAWSESQVLTVTRAKGRRSST